LTTDNYKEADLIELHDAGIILQRDGSDPRLGWGEFDLHGDSYLVDDEDIGTFLGALGIDYDRGVRIYKARTRVGAGQPLEGTEFPRRIATLLARPEGPRLLWIKAELCLENEAGEEERRWQEITYSGAWSVWWGSPGPQGAEEKRGPA